MEVRYRQLISNGMEGGGPRELRVMVHPFILPNTSTKYNIYLNLHSKCSAHQIKSSQDI